MVLCCSVLFFFFNDTATTEIYTLSLHDALPIFAGEFESGMALAVLARPVRRSTVLVGKWLGLVAFGSGFVVLAGLAQFLVVWATVGYWPPDPAGGLALDRKSTRLNSSHANISYAVFCLKKKKKQ